LIIVLYNDFKNRAKIMAQNKGRRLTGIERYDVLVAMLEGLGIDPPPYLSYRRVSKSVKRAFESLLEKVVKRALPSEFEIVGDWVTAITLADGKTLLIYGKNLRIKNNGK
jgi:hypothetical protein